jgi:hypothetical protein
VAKIQLSDPVAIDKAAGLITLSDGCILPVTNWLDDDGDDLPSFEGAEAWIAGTDSCGWMAGPMSMFWHHSTH